jgi:hypothetical protein
MPSGYSLRQDREAGYLIYGAEDVVGVFPYAEFPRYRTLVLAVRNTMLLHMALRQRQGLRDA